MVRIAGLSSLELAPRGGIRHQLDLAWAGSDRDAFQRSEEGRTAVFIVPPESPHVLLIAAVDGTPDLHPPHLRGVSREAELRVRDSELGGPPERVYRGRPLPHRLLRPITSLE